MPFVVATEAHAIPERPPLSLTSGDVVTVGRRDADWPAFVFVTTAQGSGWVPSRYLSTGCGARGCRDAVQSRSVEAAPDPREPLT